MGSSDVIPHDLQVLKFCRQTSEKVTIHFYSWQIALQLILQVFIRATNDLPVSLAEDNVFQFMSLEVWLQITQKFLSRSTKQRTHSLKWRDVPWTEFPMQ